MTTTTDAVQNLIAATAPFVVAEPHEAETVAGANATTATDETKPGTPVTKASEPDGGRTQAAMLVEFGHSAELFRDQQDRPFARFSTATRKHTALVSSGKFKDYLRRQFYAQQKSVPNDAALAGAIGVLTLEAGDGEKHDLSVRVARHGDAIYYDLCDDAGRAVRIDREGWAVESAPPILFMRHSHQQAQVEPKRGGDLDAVFSFLNVTPKFRELLKDWLVAAYIPDIPHPIPDFHGSKGSGKTLGQRVLRKLVDPSSVETLTLPRSDAELAQLFAHHWMPIFDNLDYLSPERANSLCKAVTGDGFTKRGLYSDDDDFVYQYKRVVLLNGVNIVTQRSDLLDRFILFQLERITDYREERELWAEFEEVRPYLFGAALDALSAAMACYDALDLPPLPRMADWAHWGAAIAEGSGDGAQAFLDVYADNLKIQTREAVEGDLVGQAVQELMQGSDDVNEEPTVLLRLLRVAALNKGLIELTGSGTVATKGWPKDAGRLSARLNHLSSNFADLGLELTSGHTGEARFIAIKHVPKAGRDRAHETGAATSSVSGVTSVRSRLQANAGNATNADRGNSVSTGRNGATPEIEPPGTEQQEEMEWET
jgi:hypothetical protein